MILDEAVYLEHYGKKGMRWGKRGTARAQRTLDRLDRVSKGTGSTSDKLKTTGLAGDTKTRAKKALLRGSKLQTKINNGERKTSELLFKLQGVRIKDLNYYQN